MSKLYVLNGPEIGDVFEIKEGVSYLGRAEDNDIRITNKTVSRKHLRIERKGERYFITDLESRNGTYRDGKYLVPGVETEIREGVPVAIGMSVIGVGKGCLEYLVPFLDLIARIRDPGDQLGIWGDQRKGTDQKVLELLYRVSDLLKKDSPIRETVGEILRHLFDFLKRVDRGAFILLESGTGDIKEIIFKIQGGGRVDFLRVAAWCVKRFD